MKMTRRIALGLAPIALAAALGTAAEPPGKKPRRRPCRRKEAAAPFVRHLEGPRAAIDRAGRHVGPRRRLRRRSGNPRRYYVAVASGGVWKTDQRRHHLDAGLRRRGLVLDRLRRARSEEPVRRLGRHRREQQPAQRRLRRRRLQVRATAARRWKNVGLKSSEHIGKIVIDPRDSNVVYVAAQGPLWAAGRRPRPLQDDRRRQDLEGGARRSARTPASPTSSIDPRNPDVLFAASYQRRRHVWTLIDGGPESAHLQARPTAARPGRSSTSGLPTEDLGRIGLADRAVEPGHRLRDRRGREQGRAASSARPTAASPGRSATTTSTSGRSTTRSSSSIRRTTTASTR